MPSVLWIEHLVAHWKPVQYGLKLVLWSQEWDSLSIKRTLSEHMFPWLQPARRNFGTASARTIQIWIRSVRLGFRDARRSRDKDRNFKSELPSLTFDHVPELEDECCNCWTGHLIRAWYTLGDSKNASIHEEKKEEKKETKSPDKSIPAGGSTCFSTPPPFPIPGEVQHLGEGSGVWIWQRPVVSLFVPIAQSRRAKISVLKF